MTTEVRLGMSALLSAVTLGALACKGNEPPTTGRIQVTTATTGADLDPDGYSVTLQGDTAHGTSGNVTQPIARNGKVTFSDLHPGTYSLQLGGTAVNCPIASPNPQAVTVTAGGNTDVAFHIACVQHVDLAGVWNFTEQFGDPLACNDTGSIVIPQSGDAFTGTSDQVGTCDAQGGSFDNSFSAPVSGSAVYSASGSVSISFSRAGCSYTADVAGTPPDRLINGRLDCSGSGSWTATRGGGLIASVTVSPPTQTVVAGGITRLRAVMTDASGGRRVDPTVTWISDAPGVATVDASGVVSGVAPGTATITATAEVKSGTATLAVEVVTFTVVQAGAYHSCGLTTSGAAYCWGNSTYGQVGAGSKANGLTPVAVANGLTFSAISVGAVHSCGLTGGGTAYCWGANDTGELGAGTPAAQQCGSEPVACVPFPIAVAGGHGFSSVSAGGTTTCALTSAGAAFCWGDDTYGQLGDGSTTPTSTPVAVAGGLAFVSTGAGIFFACGLTAAGEAYCWGNNSAAQLGVGAVSLETCNDNPCSTVPVAVSGGLTFTALSVGYWHACGLIADGTAYCWGDNGDGQLGATTTETCSSSLGTVTCSTSPLPVEGGLRFATLSAGFFHSCGVTAAGDGYCWGLNSDGQLGTGAGTNSASPAPIAGGLSFAALSAFGRFHSCGLSTGSIAYCWGANYWGQIGAGTGSSTPVPVIGQATATAPAPQRIARPSRIVARVPVPKISARRPRP